MQVRITCIEPTILFDNDVTSSHCPRSPGTAWVVGVKEVVCGEFPKTENNKQKKQPKKKKGGGEGGKAMGGKEHLPEERRAIIIEQPARHCTQCADHISVCARRLLLAFVEVIMNIWCR